MSPAKRRLTAIGWLVAIHGVLDVTVALYRCHQVAPTLNSILCSALPRAQIGLLILWLAVGKERFSWRVCGLVAGAAYVFSIFTRLLFFDVLHPVSRNAWLGMHWTVFFRPSGPGDLLIKFPSLLIGLLAILCMWRIARWFWRRRVGPPPLRRFRPRRPQFHFQDLLIWTATASLILVAVYQTPPHEHWFAELGHQLGRFLDLDASLELHMVLASVSPLLVTVAAVWLVYSRRPLLPRLTAALVAPLLCGLPFDGWRLLLLDEPAVSLYPSIWWGAPLETGIAMMQMFLVVASLQLVRMYESPVAPKKILPGRQLPPKLPMRGRDPFIRRPTETPLKPGALVAWFRSQVNRL